MTVREPNCEGARCDRIEAKTTCCFTVSADEDEEVEMAAVEAEAVFAVLRFVLDD